MATTETPSVTDRARLIAAGAPVVGAHFLGTTAVLVLGEEALLFVAPDGEPQRVAHLCALPAARRHRLVLYVNFDGLPVGFGDAEVVEHRL